MLFRKPKCKTLDRKNRQHNRLLTEKIENLMDPGKRRIQG